MKTHSTIGRRRESGNALMITLLMTGTALLTLAGIMSWSAGSARMNARQTQYTLSVAAAEAATEKIASAMRTDFLSGGETLVQNNLSTYRSTIPNSSDSSYWNGWKFSNAQGNNDKSYVQLISSSNFTVLTGTYAGLQGYNSTYNIISDASSATNIQSVTAGVLQSMVLTLIPIFQFSMYSSGDMEISCGQPFTIDGSVHCNGTLYVEPDSTLTTQSSVSAVKNVVFGRSPQDSRGSPGGAVTYQVAPVAPSKALTLPIGTANTPAAVAQIIQVPPLLESASSAMGQQRFYNKADMIISVSALGVATATSGNFNSHLTVIPPTDLTKFVTTTNSFYDARESKTILPIDINVGSLAKWSATNTNIRTALGTRDVSSIYVVDNRTWPSGNLGAVRVQNGAQLPSLGLAVATALPLYVMGNYNQTNAANLASTNTSTTVPAMFAADAITILSSAWSDSGSFTLPLSSRDAVTTTVNAGLLAGVVETTNGNYSGGMENFPRFLESWGSANVFWFNGSMVKMFSSTYATNMWGKANVYDPPARKWAFDINFNNPAKLPPLTPGLQLVARNQWATLASNHTN